MASEKRLAVFVDVRQQGNDAGALDGLGQITLLLSGETADTPWLNFAALGDELAKQVYVYVVNFFFG